MFSIFLVTILSCEQVILIANRLQSIALLTPQQRIGIIQELKKSVPTCPVVIKNNDRTKKGSN